MLRGEIVKIMSIVNLPEDFESTDLSRDRLSREIGRRLRPRLARGNLATPFHRPALARSHLCVRVSWLHASARPRVHVDLCVSTLCSYDGIYEGMCPGTLYLCESASM